MDITSKGSIFFIGVKLDQTIHAQALGFTDYVHLYGWGKSQEEAQNNVAAYLMGSIGVAVARFVSTSKASKQDFASYCFPEQIYGAPKADIKAAILAKPWTEGMMAETLGVLQTKCDQIARGRQCLLKMQCLAA